MGKILIYRADQVVKKTAEQKPIAVLSIEHPGVKPGETGYAPRLKNTEQKILTFWDSEHQETIDGPDIEQVEQGIAFVMEHITKGDVIIHCKAGKSRSVGIALGVLSALHPRKGETELLDILLDIRPGSAPNIIVVEMVDQLTGRNGKLLQAVKDHKEMSKSRMFAELGRSKWLKRNPDTFKKMHPEKFPPPPKP